MSSPDPVPSAPAAVPWYKSDILRGLVAAIVPQIITRLHTHYGIDLTLLGFNANMLTDEIMDAISAGALAYAAHARIFKPLPTITPTKAAAVAANEAAAAPAVAPAAGQPNPK